VIRGIWGEEEQDFKEDLRGLPLERMTGEEAFLWSGLLTAFGVNCGSVGDREDEEDDGNGTESCVGGRERKREGWLFCWKYWTESSFTSGWSCSSLKWNKAFFWVGLRLGRLPRETKAPGPGSSEKEEPHERVRLWDRRGLAIVVMVMVVVVEGEMGDVDEDEGTE
jgi:hypothetical protein